MTESGLGRAEHWRRLLEAELQWIGARVKDGEFGAQLAKEISNICSGLPGILNDNNFARSFSAAGVTQLKAFIDASQDFMGVADEWKVEAGGFDGSYPYHAVLELFEKLNPITGSLLKVDGLHSSSVPILDNLDERIRSVLNVFVDNEQKVTNSQLKWTVSKLQGRFSEIEPEYISSKGKLEDETARAREIAGRLEKSDIFLERLTTKTAEGKLVGEFENFRDRHFAAYMAFMLGTVLSMALGLGIAFHLAPQIQSTVESGGLGYPELIWRITAVTGVLGIAAYLARQAAQHRTLSTWASSIRIQLLTFDAYTLPLDDPSQVSALRTEFAMRVFGPPPQLKGEPDQVASAMDLLPLISAIAKATKADGAKGP